jgi:MobA/MobL family protein
MAIFSMSLSTIGRSTHREGTAGAHFRYIGRRSASTYNEAQHMPVHPRDARRWINKLERESRKNAWVCNKLFIALPRELSHKKNIEVMHDLLMYLTGGRVPYYFSLHDRGRDRQNPHAHLVVIDKDIATGKRVLRLSDSPRDRQKAGLVPKGVEWIREAWETFGNLALERAGSEARIDRRSLVAQGIDRIPTIHIGPRANKIDAAVWRPESKVVPSPTPRHPGRVIDYPMIDAGRTRRERNAEIIDLNLAKAARSPDFETRLWAQFECAQRVMDRPIEAQRVTAARRRTLEERRLRSGFKVQLREVRDRRHAETALVRAWTNQRLVPEIASLTACQDAQRAALLRQQGRLVAIFMAAIDFTGHTRRKYAAARQTLDKRHRRERAALAAHIRHTRAIQAEAVRARYHPEIDAIKLNRRQQIAALKERHLDAMLYEDAALQLREAEREQWREILKQQIDTWKKAQRGIISDRQSAVASRLDTDWNAKDDPVPVRMSENRAPEAPRRPANDSVPSPAPPARPAAAVPLDSPNSQKH